MSDTVHVSQSSVMLQSDDNERQNRNKREAKNKNKELSASFNIIINKIK